MWWVSITQHKCIIQVSRLEVASQHRAMLCSLSNQLGYFSNTFGNQMWVKTPCAFHITAKAKHLYCQRTQEKLHRQNHNLFPAAENPRDTRVVTQQQVGKPILRLYYNMVKMAGLKFHCIFIPLSACAREEILFVCLCIFSCECFRVVCFFSFFLSLYYTNPGRCPLLFMRVHSYSFLQRKSHSKVQ